ncbi:hypothetical protein NA57DRAFT_62508 [Rhizodiscina lignyota]|uniref:Uncharacterized protein n=1 Tax=Rhizodiscina lignyota TaxID=1504668 RepID=A0A9P4M0E9_9PEZI|nr:hypothetical protein NA57DRAFT_62508 [Rhizodiscina lignyota]
MFKAAISTLTLLAFFAPAIHASPVGGVAIYNACDFPVYSHTVTEDGGQQAPVTLAPGQWYWESYQYPKSGGPVLKLTKEQNLGGVPVTQLEYSITDGTIYYDISNVDCGPTGQSNQGQCPFLQGGMFLHSSSGCDTKSCQSGDQRCHDAYNLPDDNWAVGGCAFKNQNLVFYACRSTYLAPSMA